MSVLTQYKNLQKTFSVVQSLTQANTAMKICWFIIVLLLLHSCTSGDGMDHGIVGGRVSVPHSRPYMVYIRDLRSYLTCDGFLVREDFVMTAAHCNGRHLNVYLGVSDTHFLPRGIDVDSFPHPKFVNVAGLGNDIMLLKLKTPVTVNKTVSIIDLPKSWNDDIPKNCLVLGWGSKKFDSFSPSEVLKEVNVTLTSAKNVDIIYSDGRVGPSKGDSGGPLICGGVAHGIVSFNFKRSEDYIIGYTRISQHLRWIKDVMHDVK